MARVIPLSVTEDALRVLYATHADFSQLPPADKRGRLLGASITTLGTYDFAQVRAQSEYLRLVSIVEAYVDACCNHLFDLKSHGKELFVVALTEAAREVASNSWEGRKTAFARYHDVQLTACAKWSDVQAAVAVRNAVAHGLGSLTRRQQNLSTTKKMVSVGISFRNMAVLIDAAAISRCLTACTSFVSDVDTRIPR